MDIIFDAANALIDDANKDEELPKRFGEDWVRLVRDLLFDSEGSLTFKPGLWNDIRKVILPTLVDKVKFSISFQFLYSLTFVFSTGRLHPHPARRIYRQRNRSRS